MTVYELTPEELDECCDNVVRLNQDASKETLTDIRLEFTALKARYRRMNNDR